MSEMMEIRIVDDAIVKDLRKRALGMMGHFSLRSQGIGYKNCLKDLGLWEDEERTEAGHDLRRKHEEGEILSRN